MSNWHERYHAHNAMLAALEAGTATSARRWCRVRHGSLGTTRQSYRQGDKLRPVR